MSFLENIKSFFALAKESNYDLLKIYEQDTNGFLIALLVVLSIILIIIFLIRRSIKISSAVKLVSNIQDTKDINDYDTKLTKLVTELPKRGIKVAQSINASKNDILKQELALLKNLDISEKINRYQQIASQYALMAQNSKKYKIDELTSFYEEKSKSLLDINLLKEIEEYYTNALFDENDIKHVNEIVNYANTISNPSIIINPLQKQIDKFSYGYNLDLFKFIRGLDKNKASDIYSNCNEKLRSLFTSGEGLISKEILDYLLENDEKQNVYGYISKLEVKNHLKLLSKTMFAKRNDIDLDLSFVANKTDIGADYKSHLDNKLTENWKDLSYIKYIIESDGVLETIGHIDYRNVLERIERLQTEEENNKAVAEALEMARKAHEIANEAKAIARSK